MTTNRTAWPWGEMQVHRKAFLKSWFESGSRDFWNASSSFSLLIQRIRLDKGTDLFSLLWGPEPPIGWLSPSFLQGWDDSAQGRPSCPWWRCEDGAPWLQGHPKSGYREKSVSFVAPWRSGQLENSLQWNVLACTHLQSICLQWQVQLLCS